MVIVPIHFYLQHLKINCLFLSNACKISRVFFNWGIVPSFKIMFYMWRQISPLYDSIGEIIPSNILQAREGFNLLTFVCFLKTKNSIKSLLFQVSVYI